MLEVLIWHVSDDVRFKARALKILEQQHDGIEIVGEASNDDIAKVEWGGGYKVLLCVGAKTIGMSKVTQDARRLKLPEEKLLGDWIVCIPGFTLDKYRRLQRSQLSIFAYDCFGGMLSHLLGLPFFSPFVNLSFIQSKYFVQFLHDPHGYLEKNLIEHPSAKYNYPVAKMGDISLHMMHYRTFEESVEAWEERKLRINWYNLFVTITTRDKKDLEKFDSFPYNKKVCFVPFKSDLPSAWYINLKIDKYARDIAHAVRRFGEGRIFYYDPFDMLLYGKKTPLIDM